MKHIFILALALISLIFSSNVHAQFWQQTNGPGGTTIQSVAVNNQGHIFVASDAIMRSTDDGKSWMRIATEIAKPPYVKWTYSIKVKPTGELFLMISENTTFESTGIWRSTDDGNTWTKVNSGLFLRFNIMPGDGSILAFSQNTNTFIRSTDNGNTWTNVIPNNIFGIKYVWGDKSGHLFLNADFLYRSTDNGQNWSKIINGLNIYINSFAEAPNGHLFVDDGQGDIIHESLDGGRTWQSISVQISMSNGHSITMNPQGRLVVVEEYFQHITNDEGKTWYSTMTPNFYPYMDNYSIRILGVDNVGNFYGAASLTFFKSTLQDTTSIWSHINVPTSSVTAITRHPNGNLLAFTQDNPYQGASYNKGWIWLSTDVGNSWTIIRTDSIMSIIGYNNTVIYAIAVDSSHNILATTSGYIIRSMNGGSNWILNTTRLTTGIITAIDVRNNGEIFASSSTEGIFRSTDNGQTWDQLNTGIKNQNISSLAVHQNGDVYAGSQNIIYKSTDVGLTWQTLNTNFPAKAGNVTAMVVNTQGNIIAGIDNIGVFWSTDNGTTWAQKALGLTATKINALVSTPSGKVFAGTDSGIFFLDIIPGANWLKFNQGLTATNVLSLCRDQNGRVFAGTDVSGVFSSINTFNIAHPNGSLAAPLLASPPNGNKDMLINRKFAWHPVPGAQTYQVLISKSSDFSTIEKISDYLTDTTFSFLLNDFNVTLFWRVQAISNDGISMYSDTWNLTVAADIGVKQTPSPFTSSLSSNYPNPFSSSTIIPFTIGERSYITLEIFDALGRSYATLANGNYNAGNYEAKFNAENLSAGMYLVRLRTDKQSFTKTLEIVK